MQVVLQSTLITRWRCLVGGAKKWKQGILSKKLIVKDEVVVLSAAKLESDNGEYIIEFRWENENITFAEILESGGVLPIPPYLNRDSQPSDYERYQTVYANSNGSVAAPTAGLHFTDQVFEKLKEKGIQTLFTTLHVGAGTFKPVSAPNMGKHDMHFEWAEVSMELVEAILQKFKSGNKLIVAGTTSMRVTESLYWLGAKIGDNNDLQEQDLFVGQWEPYEKEWVISAEQSICTLFRYMQTKNIKTLHFKTGIMIAPGYKFRLADALITNFHFPKSTLLLLIAAFTGKDWKAIYNYALSNNFRFLSYGDSSLLWRNDG